MRCLAALSGVALVAAPAVAEEIAVPSGQPVTLHEVIWGVSGPEGLTVRFRFVAPKIARVGGTVDFDTAIADMAALCATYALPRTLTGTGPVPAQIIISLSDVVVQFGAAAPEATQYFESFGIEDGACIWEVF